MTEVRFSNIKRFDSALEPGDKGWMTEATTEQMLTEILHALNQADELEDAMVLLGFSPGEPQEEADRINALLEAKGLLAIHERRPGHHYLSLWGKKWSNDTDDAVLENVQTASYLFNTDPEDPWRREHDLAYRE
jgi:hypothetical protein